MGLSPIRLLFTERAYGVYSKNTSKISVKSRATAILGRLRLGRGRDAADASEPADSQARSARGAFGIKAPP